MAMGKYSRVDGKKSSGYGLTITIVLIVSLCLVGAWMFMSSWSAPTESIDFSANERTKDVDTTKSDFKSEEVDRGSKSFPDEKNEETEVVTETNEEKTDPEKSGEENSGEKTESAEERKEFDDKNGDGDRKNGDGEKDTESESDETKQKEKTQLEESSEENKSEDSNGTEENAGESEENTEKKSEENAGETEESTEKSKDVFPAGDQAEITKESSTGSGAWSTQLVESQNEKKAQVSSIKWKVCNVTAGPDYIPCLDNWQAIRKLHSTKHYEHRERHCPEESPRCLVSLPEGYKRSIKWPKSREKIWYTNIPHTKLAEVKGHQNWVKMSGEYLTFPGGGTQFKNGALHYIDFLQESYPDIAWGNRTRVILDVGCGVASFGGYLFDRDVLALSFAPKDEHEAQVQFALERGIPAMSNVMGTKRLPFPGSVFDLIHCARCRVPWHIEGGKLLLELNRALRPGGFFVWSATPVYRKTEEDVGIWKG
jgi:hypothetical protein